MSAGSGFLPLGPVASFLLHFAEVGPGAGSFPPAWKGGPPGSRGRRHRIRQARRPRYRPRSRVVQPGSAKRRKTAIMPLPSLPVENTAQVPWSGDRLRRPALTSDPDAMEPDVVSAGMTIEQFPRAYSRRGYAAPRDLFIRQESFLAAWSLRSTLRLNSGPARRSRVELPRHDHQANRSRHLGDDCNYTRGLLLHDIPSLKASSAIPPRKCPTTPPEPRAS